jgi:hypothetical protein
MEGINDDALCTCGHTLEDHHRWWLQGGGSFADECEFYGFNEIGGMMLNEEGKWVDHCHKFTPLKEE